MKFFNWKFGGQMLVRWLGMGRGWGVSLRWSTRSTGLRGWGDSFWFLRPWTPQLIRQFPNRCRDTAMHGLEATLIVIRCDFKLFLSWERKTLTKKSLHTYFNISWIETHFFVLFALRLAFCKSWKERDLENIKRSRFLLLLSSLLLLICLILSF